MLTDAILMSEENEQYAYFTVTGEFDPAELTHLVGVSPSDSWRKGELNPRNGLERKFSRWSLRSRLDKSADLEAHVTDVLEQLGANAPIFKVVSDEYGGVMQLVGYFHSYFPGFNLEPTSIKRLAEFGLTVDCDFYWLHSDAREDTG